MLSVMSRFTVFTPTSALQLECGNAMVAVPTVKYRFLCPAWYGAGLVEGALSVVGFAGSM